MVASPCRTSSPDKICPISEPHPRAAASEHLPTFPHYAVPGNLANLRSFRLQVNPALDARATASQSEESDDLATARSYRAALASPT